MTLKQAIKKTLKKHEAKVNKYLNNDHSLDGVCNCGFCDYYKDEDKGRAECHRCPVFIAEGMECAEAFPDSITRRFTISDLYGGDKDDELCEVLARMMHLHVFEEEYNAVMAWRKSEGRA